MQWTAIVATTIGTVLGVVSTLVADRIRWRRDTSERDRDALRTSFMEYLAALSQARDAFSRTESSPERVGRGHVALGEHGVYAAQQQLDLVAKSEVVEAARRATLAVLDFHDVVAAGRDVESAEYVQAWRTARAARQGLIERMRSALRRA